MKREIDLLDALISPNEDDRNGEPANVVDGLFAIARAVRRLAEAIEACPWQRTGERDGDEE